MLAFSLVAVLNATAATKAVKFGKLWDGHGIIANAVVIVENDKIQSVDANGTIPAGAEIIDLSGYTGMPGMIDSHTHMTYYWDPASGTDPRHQPPRHAAVTVFLSQANAIKTLEAVVTTVRDLTGFDGGAQVSGTRLSDGRVYWILRGKRRKRPRPCSMPAPTG